LCHRTRRLPLSFVLWVVITKFLSFWCVEKLGRYSYPFFLFSFFCLHLNWSLLLRLKRGILGLNEQITDSRRLRCNCVLCVRKEQCSCVVSYHPFSEGVISVRLCVWHTLFSFSIPLTLPPFSVSFLFSR